MSFRIIVCVATMLALAGCAGIPTDRGLDRVQQHLDERGGPTISADTAPSEAGRAMVSQWLEQPLTAETAVRVALVRSPRLQTLYAQLGIAQADLYDAARLANPTLSAIVQDSDEPGSRNQIGLGLSQNFANLLLLGPNKRIARGELQITQFRTADAVLQLAADVRAAFYQTAGTEQVAEMRSLAARAADITARLANEFYLAGNINRHELQLEQAAASELAIESIRAGAEAVAARTELNRLMGLKQSEADWTLQSALPLPLENEDEFSDLLSLAEKQRLDLIAARQEVVILEDALGLTRSYRWLGDFELGVDYERETDGSRLLGPSLALQLPIFNQGAGSVLRAQAQLERSQADTRQLEIDISNAVALASKRVGVQRDLARQYRDKLIPQREEVVARAQELQLYMIIGQFELLQAKQDVYNAYQGYIESVRDYWVSRIELSRQVGAALPSTERIPGTTLDVKSLTQPQGGGHHNHSRMQSGGSMSDGMENGMNGQINHDTGNGMEHSMKGHQKLDKGMDHSMHSNSPPEDHGQHPIPSQADASPHDNDSDKQPDHDGMHEHSMPETPDDNQDRHEQGEPQ